MLRRVSVIATLLLVALACNKKSGDSSTATSASASAAAAPSAKPQGPPIDVTLTCVASAQASSEQKSHPAAHAFDEDMQTAWNDSAPDGTGQWVEARLRQGTFVDHVEVGGGWSTKTADGQDLWPLNSSFKTMKVTWDGGSADVQFNRATDRGVKKEVKIGAVTSFVRFTATAVDKGKSADLCLDDAIVIGSCASDCDGAANACADMTFVQLATVPSTTAESYAFPLTRKMLQGHADLVGARVVEATRNGQRVMGAVTKNRCQADAIVRLAHAWEVIQPTALCEKLTVRRDVWTIDAAMGAQPRVSSAERPKPPATGSKGDEECRKTNGDSCGAGMICVMRPIGEWGPNGEHFYACVKAMP
jgi:hypothetical protein